MLRTAIKLGFLALASSVVVARPAAAYSLHLEWRAPSVCPGDEALRLAVERLLGEPLLDGTGLHATATVTADDDARFTLILAIDTPEGRRTRSLRTDTCENALEVAAFGIALALNPDLRAEAPDGAFPLDAPAPPPAPAPVVPPPRPSPAPAKRSDAAAPPLAGRVESTPHATAELWVSAAALVDSSLLPDPALGFSVAGEARVVRWLRLAFGPALFLPQDERLAAGGGGRFTLWSLQASACVAVVTMASACPVFQYGMLHAEGRGVAPRLEQSSSVAAPGLAAQGSFAVSATTSARVGFTALFPLSRDVFVVRQGTVHRLPRASFELSVGGATRAF